MDLVEDDQAEAIPPLLHVKIGAVIGRYRQIADFVVPASQEPHRNLGEGLTQQVVPLVHQLDGRRHHQSGTPDATDRHDAHQRLSGAGGQNGDSPVAAPGPGLDRRGLIFARGRLLDRVKGHGSVVFGRVGVVNARSPQTGHYGSVVERLRPVHLPARVPVEFRRRRVRGVPLSENQRTLFEAQFHGDVVAAVEKGIARSGRRESTTPGRG